MGSRPGDPDPFIVAAWGELGLRRHGEAQRVARAAIGLVPDLVEARRVPAAVLTDRAYARGHRVGSREGRRAVTAAEELVRLAPTSVPSYWVMADACAAARNARGAVAASETAMKMAPHSAHSWLSRARAARVARDYAVAEAADPTNQQTLLRRYEALEPTR